jgi:pyridoxal phosphate enzyme (YggS family)
LNGLAERLAEVRERIASAARRAGRRSEDVALVAVSKTVEPERIARAAALGMGIFGENRVQDAQRKIPEVRALAGRPLEWHCIGSLQRNKAARAAGLFDCIQSVDRESLALELERAAALRPERLRVLVQVNVDAEPQKGGVPASELPALVAALDACPHLALEGLMAVPRACNDPEEVRPSFARMRELLESLNRTRAPAARLHRLSMGMSADFEVAIEEGATLVRVGTAIFGKRSQA